MTYPAPQIAPPTTRLGQLQRGRGDGFLAALAAGREVHDELLVCIRSDPRIDGQVEARARYDAELLVAVDLPLAPVLEHLREASERELGHDVLAAAWALGHPPTRAWLAREDADSAPAAGVIESLHGQDCARAEELPAWALDVWQELDVEFFGARGREPEPAPSRPLAAHSLAELLELRRTPRAVPFATLVRELRARDSEATRSALAAVLDRPAITGAKRLAACTLGELGDLRLLPLAEELFGREDVLEDPARRLDDHERQRRAALAGYAQRLPGSIALPLARKWHRRGAFYKSVAAGILARHADVSDRVWLEAFVTEHLSEDGGYSVINELEALARIADPASLPLLVDIARTTRCSTARARCVRGVGRMAPLDLEAAAVLHEALWDCEDEACEVALDALHGSASPHPRAVQERIAALAASPLVGVELRTRARSR